MALSLWAAALIAALVALATLAALAPRAAEGGKTARRAYLVAPYLDLDRPGERGSYFALAEGCAPASGPWGPAAQLFTGAPRGFAGEAAVSHSGRGGGWRTPAYYWGRHDTLGAGAGGEHAWPGGDGAWGLA